MWELRLRCAQGHRVRKWGHRVCNLGLTPKLELSLHCGTLQASVPGGDWVAGGQGSHHSAPLGPSQVCGQCLYFYNHPLIGWSRRIVIILLHGWHKALSGLVRRKYSDKQGWAPNTRSCDLWPLHRTTGVLQNSQSWVIIGLQNPFSRSQLLPLPKNRMELINRVRVSIF